MVLPLQSRCQQVDDQLSVDAADWPRTTHDHRQAITQIVYNLAIAAAALFLVLVAVEALNTAIEEIVEGVGAGMVIVPTAGDLPGWVTHLQQPQVAVTAFAPEPPQVGHHAAVVLLRAQHPGQGQEHRREQPPDQHGIVLTGS